MIIVALGANLPGRFESPKHALISAIDALKKRGLKIIDQSRLFLTAPVPVSDQPWYHNAVVSIETPLSPFGLLEVLQDIENDFGRVRTERNAARVLDLDLIAYHDTILDKPELIVPHPRMHDRGFVLLPLADIAPNWVHPISKQSLKHLIANIPPDQVAKPEDWA